MPKVGHIADRLSAYLGGALPAEEAAEVAQHLACCADCAEERDLLAQGFALFAPLPAEEPRPGFAVGVAARAVELRPHPLGAPWWRWAFTGGLAAAIAAAVAAVAIRPGMPPGRDEMMLAQRLDLFEDLSVVQNQDALEDLEVVEVLHTLRPEGKP